MIFAKRVFQGAAVWGIAVILLGYASFLTGAGDDNAIITNNSAIVHGFFLVTFAWQVAFLIIATDPVRYRLFMLAAMLEKFPFTLAVLLLYSNGDANNIMLLMALVDGLLGVLFAVAYVVTDRPATE